MRSSLLLLLLLLLSFLLSVWFHPIPHPQLSP